LTEFPLYFEKPVLQIPVKSTSKIFHNSQPPIILKSTQYKALQIISQYKSRFLISKYLISSLTKHKVVNSYVQILDLQKKIKEKYYYNLFTTAQFTLILMTLQYLHQNNHKGIKQYPYKRDQEVLVNPVAHSAAFSLLLSATVN